MKQIVRILFALCLPVLLGVPAHARHLGPYVGGYVGGNLVSSGKSSDDQGNFNLSFNPGYQGSAVLGWDVGPDNPLEGEGRVELEYTRRSNQLDSVEFAEGKFKGAGELTVDSLLLSSYYVYRTNSILSPYAGVGVGAAQVAASNLRVTGQPLSDGSDMVFAYQLGAGVDLELSDSVSLDLGYRFFGCTNPSFAEPDGRKFKTNILNHSIVFGARWGF